MLDGLLSVLSVSNPGIVMILAGCVMFFVRGYGPRAAVMLGGPALALVTLMSSGGWGIDLATMDAFGLTLSLYRIDSLSFIFGLAFIIASALVGLYSLHREDGVQDGSALIYAGAAVGATFAGDLITLFIYWELTALASVFLIWARRTPEAFASGVRYLIIQLISGLMLIAGAALYYNATGMISFGEMGEVGQLPIVGAIDIKQPGAWLILLAFGIKAAFPLIHNWLQDSYPNATETGAVVLSAFTTKLAVYALARCFAGLDALIWIGAIMTVFPVFFAVIENDLRKVLAYSLNNQVGFMVCAVGIGGELAINGAAAHAFAHIIYKALLFMSMGAVMLRVGSTKASDLGGLHRTMPYTTICCIIGALSISAVPFFSGFAAKSMTMSAVGDAHMLWVWMMLLFASAGVLEHSGIKIPYCAFFGHDSGKRPEEAPFNMLLAMGIAAAMCIGIGVAPRWLYELLPYRDTAIDYLAHDLWTPGHLVTQFQLLVFATLAFVLLKKYALYPQEVPGVILDTEWSWRRAGPAVVGGIGVLVAGLARTLDDGWMVARGWLTARLVAVFAPAQRLSQRAPLSATAIWSAGILALVLLVALT